MSLIKEYLKGITTKQAIWTIIIVGIVVFCNVLVNDFVGDDISQIVYNNSIRSFYDVAAYFKGNFYSVGEIFNTVNYFRPMMYIVYSFIGQIFGLSAFWFHFFVAALHITNAVLLLLFLKKFINDMRAVLVIALFFLVIPINEEVAVYIANIQDSLFLFFGLLVLLKVSKKEVLTAQSFLSINFLLLASLLSKETGAAFLCLVPLWSSFFHKKESIKLAVVSGLVALEYSLLRFVVADFSLLKSKVAIAPMINLSFWERVINIPAIIFYYLKTFFLPLKLAIFQTWIVHEISFQDFFFPLSVVVIFFVLVMYLGIRIYRKHTSEIFSIYLFFVIWFILGLIPHLQLFPIDGTVADRWFYLSSAGLLVIITFAYYEYIANRRWAQTVFICIISILFVLYSARSIVRNMDWRDSITLSEHDLVINQDSYLLLSSYGALIQAKKDYDRAQYPLERAVQIRPDVVSYRMSLGVNLARLGRIDEAKEQFKEADRIAPESSVAAAFYSSLLLSQGKYNEAMTYSTEVFARPDVVDPYSPVIMALIEYKQGNTERALDLMMKSPFESPIMLAKDIFWKMKRNEVIEDKYMFTNLIDSF